ncbi:hypothetical protein [Bacillus sp. FSL K6-3431]|uniref:hypothetical protein n=1 Tax=Bacillus sp. FSL K6-3431 TaxID=2921500 RepID=UPI0030FCDE8A
MNDNSDTIISTISYIKIRRTIELNQQKYIKTEYCISLYENKITTSSNQFKLESVFDVSYRPFSDKFGFLYLHTSQGVFAFEISSDPYYFMEKVRQLIKRMD